VWNESTCTYEYLRGLNVDAHEEEQLIGTLSSCLCVPSISSCAGSAIFPGLTGAPCRAPNHCAPPRIHDVSDREGCAHSNPQVSEADAKVLIEAEPLRWAAAVRLHVTHCNRHTKVYAEGTLILQARVPVYNPLR
jgi:hypothetical protein